MGEINVGGTGNLFATNELPVDMHNKRMTASPALTALTTVMLRLQRSKAHNFRIDLTEDNKIDRTVTIAASEATPGSSISVLASGITCVQDTILYNPRIHEHRRVTANPSTNTVAVTNYAGTAGNWLIGDTIFVLLPALAENDALSTFRKASVTDSNVFNYIQLMKIQMSITRTANKMTTHFGGAGSKRIAMQAQKNYEYRVKDEQQKWLGARATGGTAPASRYSTGGIVSFLRDGTLYKNFGGTYTESALDNWLGDYYDENPDAKKIAYFCSPNVIRRINAFSKNKIRISPNSKEYGLSLNRYIGGPLEVDLIPVPIFTDSITKGWGFLLDLERIMLKTIEPMTLYKDALDIGVSEEIIDTFRGQDSMHVANESRHSMHVGALV